MKQRKGDLAVALAPHHRAAQPRSKTGDIGALTGARAHVVHASLARGFELCEMYRTAGHKASIETCVQYLMLNGESDMQRLGAKAKHYPPLRPQSEVELLWTPWLLLMLLSKP